MRTFSTTKTLFFMSTIAICVNCGGGGAGDGAGSGSDNLLVDGRQACKTVCQMEDVYVHANIATCDRALSLDGCKKNCDEFYDGSPRSYSRACTEAQAALEICLSNSANVTISCSYGQPGVNGCPDQGAAQYDAC